MKHGTSSSFGLPSTESVLGTIVDVLGVPKNSPGFNYDDLKQLRNGTITKKRHDEILLAVMEAIVAAFTGPERSKELLKVVIEQKQSGAIRRIQWLKMNGLLVPVPEHYPPKQAVDWEKNPDGSIKNVSELVIHDGLEFLLRHDYLLSQMGSATKAQESTILLWLHTFVIPFLAMNLFEYVRADADFERGMPAGRFWYLPNIKTSSSSKNGLQVKYPINSVLEWWEDLLGVSLESLAHRLTGVNESEKVCDNLSVLGGFEDAQRQVREWMKDDCPPKLKTINYWCSQKWEYQGCFVDNRELDLRTRWQHCRDFLVRKGLNNTQNDWLMGLGEKEKERMLKQYRGELLELEIFPFKKHSFQSFFDSSDPVSEGLPVEELIWGIAERFSKPTNEQLRARLTVAAAFQRSYNLATNQFGQQKASELVRCFEQVYSFLVDIHNEAKRFGGPERETILLLLQKHQAENPFLVYVCTWIFDNNTFNRLPHDLVSGLLERVKPK